MVIQKVESMRGRKSDFVVLKSNIQVLRMQEKLLLYTYACADQNTSVIT